MHQATLSHREPVLLASSQGILWMLLATFLFVSLDAIAKHLVQSYSVPQVVWARYCFHLLFLILLLRRRLPQVLVAQRLGLQCVRSLMLLLTTALFFWGLCYVPLARATSIMLVTPIIVTLLAAPLLQEAVGRQRWLGVFAGFAGALIILRPDTDIISLLSLLPLGAAVMYALYQITTRLISRTDAPMTTLVYTALFGAFVASFFVPFFWISPDAEGWFLMAATGLLGGLGHFSLIKAFQHSHVSVVAPFSYTNLLWSILYGIAFFDEYPVAKTLVGATIILASGLYILYREQAAKRSKRSA